jgi:hypothetical protein
MANLQQKKSGWDFTWDTLQWRGTSPILNIIFYLFIISQSLVYNILFNISVFVTEIAPPCLPASAPHGLTTPLSEIDNIGLIIKKNLEVKELPLILIHDKTQWCWLIYGQSHLVGKDVVIGKCCFIVQMPKNISQSDIKLHWCDM